MEYLVLEPLLREVRGECLPSRLRTVTQSAFSEVTLVMGRAGERRLRLGTEEDAPGLYLAAERERALAAPTAFCRLLRRHLAGKVCVGAAPRGREKAAELRFGDSAASPPRWLLAAEFTGRPANLVLVDEETGLIIDALHHIHHALSGRGPLLPGLPYAPPARPGMREVTELDDEELLALAAPGAPRRRSGPPVIGLGPGLAALLAAAAADPGVSLRGELGRILARCGEGELEPVLCGGLLLPFPPAGPSAAECLPFPTMSAAAEHSCRERREGRQRGALAAREAKVLRKRRKRLRRALEKIAADVRDGGEAGELTAVGQRILAAMEGIPRGAGEAFLPDPADPDAPPLRVTLDPALTARRNAERYFHRARKAKRRVRATRARTALLSGELAELEGELASLEGMTLVELLRRRAPGKERPGRRARRAAPRLSRRVREFRSPSGWRILVGKNREGNEEVTGRIAAPQDWWFHARDYPGAHVVLKGPDRSAEPPAEAIEAAAQTAAYYSGARTEGAADVSWLRRREVRKLPGAPGKVLLPQARTLRVEPRLPEGFEEVAAEG